jgi:hypothetical protein
MPQIVASLTDDPRGVINDRKVFIVQVTNMSIKSENDVQV